MLDAASRFNQASSIGPLRRALTFRSWTMMNSQGCVLLPEAAFVAASRIWSITSFGIGSGLNSRIDLRLLIPFRRPISAGIVKTELNQPRLKTHEGEWTGHCLALPVLG